MSRNESGGSIRTHALKYDGKHWITYRQVE